MMHYDDLFLGEDDIKSEYTIVRYTVTMHNARAKSQLSNFMSKTIPQPSLWNSIVALVFILVQ